MLSMINRSAILIRFKEPYVMWAERLDGGKPDSLTGNIYLIDEADTGSREEARLLLRKYWREIADEEFHSWWTEASAWPELKTIKDFEKYFAWEYAEMVGDLCETVIVHDDEDPAKDQPDHSLN